MARPALKGHSFTVDGTKFLITLPDVYDSTGNTIGQAFGLSKLSDTYTPDDSDASLTVSEGLKTGKLIRLRLSYKVAGKAKSARVVCPTQKVDTGLSAVLGKTYKGADITGAGVPRRRRLG